MATSKECDQMIKDCKDRQSRLSEWESDFIESIGFRLGMGHGLSEKQIATLEKIWDKITEAG